MNANLPAACAETDAFLVDLAFGEELGVPPAARAHLEGCDRCRTELDELARTRRLADTLPLEEPSEALDRNVLAALDAHFAGEDLGKFLKDSADLAPVAQAMAPPARMAALPAPAPARPHLSVIDGEGGRSASPAAAPRRAPRRWLGAMSAAAGLAVVVGGAYLVSRDGSLADRRPEAAAVPAEAKAVPAPVVAQPVRAVEAAKPAEPQVPENTREKGLADESGAALADGRAGAADKEAAKDAERQAQAVELEMLVDRAQLVAKSKKDASSARVEQMLKEVRQPAAKAEAMPATPMPAAPVPPPVAAAPAKKVAEAPRAEVAPQAKNFAADDLGEAKLGSLGGAGGMGYGAGLGAAGPGSASGAPKAQAAPKPVAAPRPTVDGPSTLAEGRKLLAAGSYAAALQAFEQALASGDPATQEAALDGKVNALLALHRYDEADRAAHELFRRAPGRADALTKVQRARAADAPKAAAPSNAGK